MEISRLHQCSVSIKKESSAKKDFLEYIKRAKNSSLNSSSTLKLQALKKKKQILTMRKTIKRRAVQKLLPRVRLSIVILHLTIRVFHGWI